MSEIKQIELDNLEDSRNNFKKYANVVTNKYNFDRYCTYISSLCENPFNKHENYNALVESKILNENDINMIFREYRKSYLAYHDLELIDFV